MSLEHFGVEKSLEDIEKGNKETRKVKGLENFSREEINQILDGIAALQKNIEYNWIALEHDYAQKLDKEQYDLLNFLKQGLSLWKSSESIREIVGKRKSVYGRTLFTETPNDVFTTEQSQQDTCVETIDQEINSVAIQWGFDVVRIMGDGNCFFTSVAFQVSQLLTRSDLQTHVREHFYSLGILPEV